MLAFEDRGRRRRRHRRGTSRRSPVALADPLLFGKIPLDRAVFVAMAILGCGLAINAYRSAEQAAQQFGQLSKGMSRDDVRYVLGSPQQTDPANSNWGYRNAGTELSLRFDAAGTLNRARCRELDGALERCPAVLGVDVGSSESEVRRQLGEPSAAQYDQETKILYYGDLGLALSLHRAKVEMLEHNFAGTTLGIARVAVERILP